MKITSYGRIFFLILVALLIQACGQGQDQGAPATSDTAVHDAEVASGAIGDVMARGEAVYLANCAACHQPTGQGLVGAFPPLADSDYLLGDRRQVMQAALFGLSGPITVNGVDYNGVMPSMGFLPDQDLADALTYVLGSWGNSGSAVSVEEVAALRAELGESGEMVAGERHTGATEGELGYRGRPSQITPDETRPLLAGVCGCHAALLRTLRRLSWSAAQGRNRQAADAGYHDRKRIGLPEGAHHLRIPGRNAELGQLGRLDARADRHYGAFSAAGAAGAARIRYAGDA
jgi:mono/diheme cytochrome c family protein